jgi:hypothetical protein
MNKTSRRGVSFVSGLAALALGGAVLAQQDGMSFFVTSAGAGKGADFGGLAGADRHCAALAKAAGAKATHWRAYLSTSAAGGETAVNARDRSARDRGAMPKGW